MSVEDQAQELELARWEANNTPHNDGRRYKKGDAGYGPKDCDECGSKMPPQRREWGYTICVHCKEAEERRVGRLVRY